LPFVFDNEWPAIIHHYSANDTIMAGSFNSFWTVRSLECLQDLSCLMLMPMLCGDA